MLSFSLRFAGYYYVHCYCCHIGFHPACWPYYLLNYYIIEGFTYSIPGLHIQCYATERVPYTLTPVSFVSFHPRCPRQLLLHIITIITLILRYFSLPLCHYWLTLRQLTLHYYYFSPVSAAYCCDIIIIIFRCINIQCFYSWVIIVTLTIVIITGYYCLLILHTL
jgi:hypothetical protein